MEGLIDSIEYLMQKRDYVRLRQLIEGENEADLAAVFDELFDRYSGEQRDTLAVLFRLLPKDMAAETFSLMNSEMQEALIGTFSDTELKEMLDQIFIDDTVDIIEEMPANVVARILKNSTTGARRAINEILRYPRDSAGSLMTIEYINLHKDMTVSESFAKIRRVGVNKETIYTAYVTENRRLIGVVTVRDLFMADEDDKIGDIMETNIISVNTHEDREVVAQIFEKYGFLALPVVDKDMRLVGIVTFDDAMDVIEEENTEDVTKMAAIVPNEESYFKTGVFRHALSRIGWLIVLMISAILTERILIHYENIVQGIPILIALMPMITDTGGNCGSQSSTMIIRGLALGEVSFKDFFRVVFKEFRISILVSAVLAAADGVVIYAVYGHSLALAAAIAVSIVCTVIMAKLIGSMLPLLAKRAGLDPAIVAAPLITTIVDTCAIIVYFNIAMRILSGA